MCRTHGNCKDGKEARAGPSASTTDPIDSPDGKPNYLSIDRVGPTERNGQKDQDVYAEQCCPEIENDKKLPISAVAR